MVRRKVQPRNVPENQPRNSSLPSSAESSSSSGAEIEVKVKQRINRVEREIKAQRRSTKLLIPKAPFLRIVRDIIEDIFPQLQIRRIQEQAVNALREAVEMYMVLYYEDAILLAYHADRTTLMQRDMVMLRRLRGRDDIINR